MLGNIIKAIVIRVAVPARTSAVINATAVSTTIEGSAWMWSVHAIVTRVGVSARTSAVINAAAMGTTIDGSAWVR